MQMPKSREKSYPKSCFLLQVELKNEWEGRSSSAFSAEHVDGFCNSGVGLQMKIMNFVKSKLYQLAITIPDQKLWR